MKKTWIVFNERLLKNGREAEDTEDDDVGTHPREREHASLFYAEKRAEELAKKYPGHRYIVCEIVSAFVVNGLTKETAVT
jgi:hypothetical protein